jgi:hypothetical protein
VPAQLDPEVTYSARTKSADGLLDKVFRMRRGNGGKAPRPGYQLGDVIDAVGGRITVETPEQLAQLLEAVKAYFGTGDSGRILEIENFCASPKSETPSYRLITLIIRSKANPDATFELQLTTRLASVAADLNHNTLYKALVKVSDTQGSKLMRWWAEAAALEQGAAGK